MPTVGRNDPCPCGSGKKAKRCCCRPGASAPSAAAALAVGANSVRTEHPASHGSDAAQAHFTHAQARWAQGDLEGAAESLRRGLALRPRFAEAHNNLGLLLHALGRRDAAAESLRKAIALKPDYA